MMVSSPFPASPSRSPQPPAGPPRLRISRLGAAWVTNRLLALVALGTLALAIPFIIGIVADPRVITGAPAWLKPTKFALSIAIYSLTLLWFLTFVQGHRRLVSLVSWGTTIALGLEIAIIGVQAGRGTTSHFNTTTWLDGQLFKAMGIAIFVVWGLGLVAAVVLLRQRLAPASLAWSLRLGLLAALVGMAVAIPMVAAFGAHTVGRADGGPGLPIVGWSTVGGDLRVGHFFGIHAMQALPLLAWALARFGPVWLSERRRTAMVIIAGSVWIGLILLLTWQALRGQPLIAPDATTLLALGAVLGAAALAVVAIVGPAWRVRNELMAVRRSTP